VRDDPRAPTQTTSCGDSQPKTDLRGGRITGAIDRVPTSTSSQRFDRFEALEIADTLAGDAGLGPSFIR
jgi:hypothetical protein